jgi:hypothetical protein
VYWKQTSLLEQVIVFEQVISHPPIYHVIYHDPYLISNPYFASKCGVHFKTFIQKQQIKLFPLHTQKYLIFYVKFFLDRFAVLGALLDMHHLLKTMHFLQNSRVLITLDL